MRYYIKPANTNDVSGPFEIEELSQRVCDQLIDSKWLATADLGEIDSLRQGRQKDLFLISEIPGIVGIEELKPLSPRKFSVLRQVALFVLIGACLFVGFFILLRIWLGDIH